MSATDTAAHPSAAPITVSPSVTPRTPGQLIWWRFRQHRLGYISAIIFCVLFGLSMFAEFLSNDHPIVAYYNGHLYWPLVHDYPEKNFGGDFPTQADYLDPFIRDQFSRPGNWALYPPNIYSYDTLNYFSTRPNPAAPSAENWFGTDDRGRDVFARALYGFRISVLFGFALTIIGTIVGIMTGAIQGYFGGKIDLYFQRFMEIWGSMPELYLLLIFASIFAPSITLLLILLSLFGWMNLSDYVRAEFLRNRSLDYVRAARSLGLSNRSIMWRHILPNSLTPVITFLPFRMSAAITALTSLDFLGLGVPPSTPSLGELLKQGKENLDAWWIGLTAFLVLFITLLLLVFIGEALRDAIDTRKEIK